LLPFLLRSIERLIRLSHALISGSKLSNGLVGCLP
jgi:hypothetical protein